MSEFIRIASRTDLPARGESIEVRVRGKAVCLANVEGRLVAVGNICAHQGAPLSAGAIDEGKLVCPWHGWRFDPHTGKSEHYPDMAVPVYELKVVGDDVLVRVE